MSIEAIAPGVLAAIGAGALGGLIGGALTTARRNLFVSMLIGAIVGLSAATILRMLEIEPYLGVEDFSLIYAGAAGALASYLISSTST